MPNVNFAARADAYRGYRTPVAPNANTDTWLRNYIPKITTRPYPKITYPRPRSERAAFLHTQWDKWIAGYAWNPRIGVKDGHWPYRVYLTGSPPSGTTYANVIEDDNGTTSRHLRLYCATPTAGTYTFTINIVDQYLYTTSVGVVLTVYAQADADILNQFRVIDAAAGGGGDGSPTTPYNNWASMIGATYSNSNCLVILKGTLTVNAATSLGLGGTKPKQIIGLYGSAWTFNLTGVADKFTFTSSDGNDSTICNMAITGQAAAGANQSQIGQANTRDRTAIHDVAFSNLTSSGTSNHGCFGGDGDATRYYLTVLNCSGDNIGGGGTNCECITFEQNDGLVDQWVSTNPNLANKSFSVIHWKHDNVECETRRVTALTVDGYSYPPVNYGSGGSASPTPTNTVKGTIRHCNLAYSTNAANKGCIQMGPDPADTQTLTIVRNTFSGEAVFRLAMHLNVANQSWYDLNLCQNADTNNGIGAITNETSQSGRVAVLGDNYGASSGVIDASGNPLIGGHLGRYGHRLY